MAMKTIERLQAILGRVDADAARGAAKRDTIDHLLDYFGARLGFNAGAYFLRCASAVGTSTSSPEEALASWRRCAVKKLKAGGLL